MPVKGYNIVFYNPAIFFLRPLLQTAIISSLNCYNARKPYKCSSICLLETCFLLSLSNEFNYCKIKLASQQQEPSHPNRRHLEFRNKDPICKWFLHLVDMCHLEAKAEQQVSISSNARNFHFILLCNNRFLILELPVILILNATILHFYCNLPKSKAMEKRFYFVLQTNMALALLLGYLLDSVVISVDFNILLNNI